jgi:hypothetical protein
MRILIWVSVEDSIRVERAAQVFLARLIGPTAFKRSGDRGSASWIGQQGDEISPQKLFADC